MGRPLERVGIDLTDMIAGSQGHRYVFTVDHYSRFVKFYPLKSNLSLSLSLSFSLSLSLSLSLFQVYSTNLSRFLFFLFFSCFLLSILHVSFPTCHSSFRSYVPCLTISLFLYFFPSFPPLHYSSFSTSFSFAIFLFRYITFSSRLFFPLSPHSLLLFLPYSIINSLLSASSSSSFHHDFPFRHIVSPPLFFPVFPL